MRVVGRLRASSRPSLRILRSLPMPLLAAGVMATIAVPAAAATFTAMRLEGVGITAAGAVRTSPAAPATLRAYEAANLGGGTCTPIYTAPAGVALVLQQLTVNVFFAPSSGPGRNVRIATDPACTKEIGDVNPGAVGATSMPLLQPIVVPAGHRLYAAADNGILAEVFGYGYVKPNADATASGPR